MFQLDSGWFQISPWLLIIAAIIIVVFTVFVVIWGIRAHQLQISAGKEELVGKTAIVETALKPKGVVFIQGELWTAISDSGPIKAEEEVIITKIEGLKLRVTKK